MKGKCEQKYKFVCKLDQSNFVRECDEGFEKIQGDDDYCYKYEARCYKLLFGYNLIADRTDIFF